MTSSSPTLILVHGAWHSPYHFKKILPLLASHNLRIATADPPTTHGDASISFSDDVIYIEKLIQTEVELGNKVVLVGHSYGSALAQSAVKRYKNEIQALVLISAFFKETGETQLQSMGGTPPPFFRFEDSFAVIQVDAKDLFYHDCQTQTLMSRNFDLRLRNLV